MSFFTRKHLVSYYSYMTITRCRNCDAEYTNFSTAVNVAFEEEGAPGARGSMAIEELANLFANVYSMTPQEAMDNLPRLPFSWRHTENTTTRCPLCTPTKIGSETSRFPHFVPGIFSPKDLEAMRDKAFPVDSTRKHKKERKTKTDEERAIAKIKHGKLENLL